MNLLNPHSLASVMQAIASQSIRSLPDGKHAPVKVSHDELVALRKRAIALSKQDTRIANPASVALVFLGGLQQGSSAAEILKADSRKILRLAREFEKDHGDTGKRG